MRQETVTVGGVDACPVCQPKVDRTPRIGGCRGAGRQLGSVRM